MDFKYLPIGSSTDLFDVKDVYVSNKTSQTVI